MNILLPLWLSMETVSTFATEAQRVHWKAPAMIAHEESAPHQTQLDWLTGLMRGASVQQAAKTLGEMAGMFHDANSLRAMDQSTVLYRVQWTEPVAQGTEGGLFWGSTIIEPGRVGDEYFMTHGHFHLKRDRGEYYGTIGGKGMLVLMDQDRVTTADVMFPGSLHFIAGGIAHRVVNTGDEPLLFWACWPSDAGHDYGSIKAEGFGARVLYRDGGPVLIPA
jgi:glucose-6-phosphate isomerase